MEELIVLSKEERNRIGIWSFVMSKVNNYCAVCKNQDLSLLGTDFERDLGCYYLQGKKNHYSIQISIRWGLLEAAVIGFSSIFKFGDQGEGIAKNNSEKVILIKREMIKRTAIKLGYTQQKLKEYIDKIVKIRDRLIAHYDGSIAEYKEVYLDKSESQDSLLGSSPEIKKYMAPIVTFTNEEIGEFYEIAIAMHETLLDLYVELDKNSFVINS